MIRDPADDTQQLDVSVRLPDLTYIVASNEETPEEAQVGRQCSEVLRTVWGNRFERASYQDGWNYNDAAVTAVQLKDHLKWLDDEESMFQFLVGP